MLTVDANVWVAAADRLDTHYESSRRFLTDAARRRLGIYLPSFAWIEIACALARKRQDAGTGRQLASKMLDSPYITRVPLDGPCLAQALLAGTEFYLRGADAIYAATAKISNTQLVSWDAELIRRAGAVTPADWLAANP